LINKNKKIKKEINTKEIYYIIHWLNNKYIKNTFYFLKKRKLLFKFLIIKNK